MIGRTFSHYKILDKIAEGGMGVLYRAVDTRLDRTVAIKLIRPEAMGSAERKERFIREAKAASALNHPNIITIYDIGRSDELDYIVMEYVDGTSLAERIAGRVPSVTEALEMAIRIASALSAAHEAGIVHRDVKPSNVMISRSGQLKVLDFGLAKLLERGGSDESATTMVAGVHTEEGTVLGTAAYMSPEQAEGKAVDARSDVFSLGVLFYEMLSGRRPFQGDSNVSIRLAILREDPLPLEEAGASIPPELERIVLRCLAKSKEDRFSSAGDVLEALRGARSAEAGLRGASRTGKRLRLATAALLLLLAAALASWWWRRSSRVLWVHDVAVAEIEKLVAEGDNIEAVDRLREAREILPEDPKLDELWKSATVVGTIVSDPPEVNVFWTDYHDVDGEWRSLGPTPHEEIRLPFQYLRWRFTKDGYENAEAAGYPMLTRTARLEPEGSAQSGMIRIGARTVDLEHGERVVIDEFWIDRHEVTNAAFQAFVDAGGYETRDYWKHPFVKDGAELTWKEAMLLFRDRTGRPGPSTWELGAFPEGQGSYPVSGISWYEAAAYAEFAGKVLPTLFHWRAAAYDVTLPPETLDLSNFEGDGPVPVGSGGSLGPFGTYDMGGNVKEWCWNAVGERRYSLGGSFRELPYLFTSYLDASFPFERQEDQGFRCARYQRPPPESIAGAVERAQRDYSRETPVPDDVFEFFESIYDYDPAPFNASTERMATGSEPWIQERITFDAAYGGERIAAYLFLPANSAPPYQTVVFFPGSDALYTRSFQQAASLKFVDFLPRSGRAVLSPVFHGMYERGNNAPLLGPNQQRDLVVQWAKDLRRSIDYLETREDIDFERIAYLGLSLGARYGPLMTAVERRFRAAVYVAGGLVQEGLGETVSPRLPEVDPFHFLPRSTVPTVMINGRYDFARPVDTHQRPLFDRLGAPEEHKRHVLFDSGHVPPRIGTIQETLDWLDAYLGPVPLKR